MQTTRVKKWTQSLIYGILLSLPFERIPSLELTHPAKITIRISQVLALLLIGINLPMLWKQRRDWIATPWRWLTAFVLVCVISACMALDLKRAVLVTAYTIFVAILAYVLANNYDKDRSYSYRKYIMYGAAIVCVFGIYQFFGDLVGLPTWITGLRPQYTKAVFGFPRVQSTGLEPLYFGNYLLIPMALAALAFLKEGRRWWVALIGLTTVAGLTLSRGTYAAIIFITIVLFVWGMWSSLPRKAIGLVAAVVAGSLLAAGLIAIGSVVDLSHRSGAKQAVNNFSNQATNLSTGESAEGRTITRKLALSAFKSMPAFGIGPGNFGGYAHRHMPSRFVDTQGIVNNEPLELLAETGFIGLTAFGLFCLSIAWMGIKVLRDDMRLIGFESGLLLAMLLILVGDGIQYQTFSTLYITHIWVTIGLLCAAANPRKT